MMPLEVRQVVDVDPNEKSKIFRLLGLTKKTFLSLTRNFKFLKQRSMPTESIDSMLKNTAFAKEFFNIIDEKGDGGIGLEDLAIPLISLGLATNIKFVQKALKVLNPSKFGAGKFDKELTMREFAKIFESDKTSLKLITLVIDELNKKDKELSKKSP